MIFRNLLYSLFLPCGVCFLLTSKPLKKTMQCEYYNASSCDNKGSKCNDVEYCGHEVRSHCFVVWKINASGEFVPQLKGCFTNNVECYDQFQCVEKRPEPVRNVLFCCCEGDMCNKHFTWDPVAPSDVPTKTKAKNRPLTPSYEPLEVYIFLPVMTLVATIAVVLWFVKNRKIPNLNHANEDTDDLSQDLPLANVELFEIKALGRFGAVWKAQYKSEIVAVKIFPIQDKKSWLRETEIYQLPHMDNPDILQFIGAEKRGENLNSEYWLVTAFHEKGSLCDYLKTNVVCCTDLYKITKSIARGLMFLHDDIRGAKGEDFKPAIAHRDIKSKNILLKSDMSACIADFGSALILSPDKPLGNTYSQVGTVRYMAPEVLDGAIHFTRDGFLRIDMYACGLVLWELVSRCTAQDCPIPEYMLPFEDDLGQHPNVADMKEYVVDKKKRPILHESWRQHPALSLLCQTIEECWDEDAEARITSACIVERISDPQNPFSQYAHPPSGVNNMTGIL